MSTGDGSPSASFAPMSPKPEENLKPDPEKPTITELAAGIQAECHVLSSDFIFTATASETLSEKELCVAGNAQALGEANHQCEFSPFRYFDETGKAETGTAEGDIGDAVFQATKVKGTRLWIYQRETSKKSTDPWAADDEVDGYEFLTDNPQHLERSGYIKRRIVGAFQDLFLNGEVAVG